MSDFKQFIIFAEMRTGSNFLEDNLNQFSGITCYGEVYNPHFIGYPSQDDLFGITLADREEKPLETLTAIQNNTNGLGGFRFFHDHDIRAFEACIDDPQVAKIVLTRNPLDSFVSWKIASATGQWKLTNPTNRREESVEIHVEEFESHLAQLQSFQIEILNRLQRSGQTAFYVAYEDLQDVEVMNGLARFLGCNERLDALSKKLKKQNPAPISEKVQNYASLESSLARLDQFNLSRTPNFEPRRGPIVPNYVAAASAPLLFMPIKSGPDQSIRAWLSAMDGVAPSDLKTNFSQKTLRQWKRQHKGHRSFTVVRHPVLRAYEAFCRFILPMGAGTYKELRKTLRRVHNVQIPKNGVDETFTATDMHKAFSAFLVFLKANLSGQTAVRVDAAWASQAHIVQGFTEFAAPDLIVREDCLHDELAFLSSAVGLEYVHAPNAVISGNISLDAIYDDGIEALVREAYQKDYLMFGFGPYRKN